MLDGDDVDVGVDARTRGVCVFWTLKPRHGVSHVRFVTLNTTQSSSSAVVCVDADVCACVCACFRCRAAVSDSRDERTWDDMRVHEEEE